MGVQTVMRVSVAEGYVIFYTFGSPKTWWAFAYYAHSDPTPLK